MFAAPVVRYVFLIEPGTQITPSAAECGRAMSTGKIANIAAVDFDLRQTLLPVVVSRKLRIEAGSPNAPPGGFFPCIAIGASIGQVPRADLLLNSLPLVSH